MNIKSALSLGESGVISLVGAGGKTSLMYALARELVALQKRVLTTTTTKIFMPTAEESTATIVSGDPKEIVRKARSLLKDQLHLTVGCACIPDQGKLKGLAPADLAYIRQSHLFDFILIEADGAARRSLKACASHEPVVPGFSDIIVSLVGLDVVGRPLEEAWVFRSGLFSQISGLPLMRPVTESAIAAVLLHDMVSLDPAGKEMLRIAFLNKADHATARMAGERIAALIEEKGGGLFHRVIIGELKRDPVIHHCLLLK